jgi:thiol-disulfide isomerase/thioredoxin
MQKDNTFVRLFIPLLLVIGFGLVVVRPVVAHPSSATSHPVVIYLFWGDGCPHCAAAKPFLQDLTEQYPGTEIRSYEVWYVEENQVLLHKMGSALAFEPKAVPTIILGDRSWVGYNEQIALEIEDAVKACSTHGCKDAGVGIIPGITAAAEVENAPSPGSGSVDVLQVPLLGEIHLAAQSLWISTALISFVDGVNPCSVWVLTMLLAITLHTGSRKKVVTIGLIFLTVTAAIYALFIAGMFTMFTVVSFVGWIQIVVALVALFFGLVNIKDYFWYKQGLSFTIPDGKKAGIYTRMRRLVDASQSFWGLAGATVVLAAGVSLVEFSCTAGFPVLWTNLLVAQKVTGATFVLLLLLYLVIYQLDEMAIFFVAVFTLKASKLEEKHGRILKLIGGTLMLTLAGVMLVNPALMNNLASSLVIFGAAALATGLVLLVHRVVLPRWGIRVGTGLGKASDRRR